MRHVILGTLLLTALAAPLAAQQPDAQAQRITIPLSDPGRPGSLQVDIVMGSITVKGSNRKDMLIEARGSSFVGLPRNRRAQDEPPPPGLRRLTQNAPFTVEEDRNEVSIEVEAPTRSIDFTIEVPLRTNLDVETVMGSVTVEGIEGELEIESVNGAVTLTNVGGSVVAHTVNGKLLATIARATPQQPMAFTSLNGSVDVTLPANVKANLKLRSDQGDVYTDFDLQQVRQDAANPNPNQNPNPNVDIDRNRLRRDIDRQRADLQRRRVEIDNAIYGSINGGGPDFEMRTFNGNVYVRKGK
jgi:putative adhesin